MDRLKLYEALIVLGALMLGLFLRLVPARNALVGGDVLFYGYDSFYHMRRIFYTVENFPHTLWFDSYLNHPFGHGLLWPPLFDQVVAGASLIFGGSDRAVEMTGALVPPVLGAGSILVLYLLAKKLFGARVGFLSAFLLVVDPKHIARTQFGCTDHDALESLLIFGAILLLAYALTERDRRLWFGAAVGVLMAAVAYTWLGAPIYMGAILIYATIQVALDLRDGVPSEDTVVPLMAAFGVALLLLLPFRDEAWLVPSFFGSLGGLAALAFLYLLSRLFVAKRAPWQAFVPLVAILGYLGVILSYATATTREIGSLFWRGLGYFFLSGPAKEGILEAAPIYEVFDFVSLPGLSFAFSLFGIGVAIHYAWRSRLPKDQVLFLVWAVFTLTLTVFQARFLYLFSISGSILVALLFFWGADRTRASVKADSLKVRALHLALLAVILLPNVSGLTEIAEDRPEVAGDWLETLDWLEKNTPATEGFERPIRAGEYGVLSWWDYGNWILYQSRRPVVANNFHAGAMDAARFFLSEREEEAVAIADLRDARYVVTDEKMIYRKLPAIVRWIDEDPEDYIAISADLDLVTFEHSERFLGSVLARLHLLDCTNLGHFRLVYESKTTTGLKFSTSEIKIFERVEGAKIAGTTPYDKPIGVILEMESNQGRRFQYFNSAMPVDGRYKITVPYSTDGGLETHSIGPYLVGPVEDFAGGESRDVEVSEEAVLLGRVVEVNF
ncbi:MAG TPA: STT3 domain-containing protein [Methanothrix sp.]|nr:STT3 domain-containing protein [Methanothrix sp.]HPJ83851.1 STT3 domain-containing protein [Methanothrix sp.]